MVNDSSGVGTKYGFTVGGNGVATATVNVGSNGAAFGVANNTVMTGLDVLLAADAQAVNGVLYNGNTTKRNTCRGFAPSERAARIFSSGQVRTPAWVFTVRISMT